MSIQRITKTIQDRLTWLHDQVDQVVAETLHLCRIPAPTFDESERAVYVAERMRAIGLDEVRIDALHNVTGQVHSGDHGPTTLVAAHLDTVFPRSTPLEVRRTAKKLYGPSIGDNSVAVAAMLGVATAMRHLDSRPRGRVIFAGSVGEEGLGNLCGIRALLETWQDRIDTVIAVEGHGLDEVRHAGIGSSRWEVTFRGPGGHSWGAFGTPSAIHAMGSAIHALCRLEVSQAPKTTYNIGLVEGGESINTIAPLARMLLDLRSAESDSLAQLEGRVDSLLQKVERDMGIRVTHKVIGKRPAAALPVDHPLYQGVNAIRQQLQLRPARFDAASTDANLPLSLGIPAVCLGITQGGLAHTVQEFIEVPPIASGLQQLFLTTLYTLSSTARDRWRGQ